MIHSTHKTNTSFSTTSVIYMYAQLVIQMLRSEHMHMVPGPFHFWPVKWGCLLPHLPNVDPSPTGGVPIWKKVVKILQDNLELPALASANLQLNPVDFGGKLKWWVRETPRDWVFATGWDNGWTCSCFCPLGPWGLKQGLMPCMPCSGSLMVYSVSMGAWTF